MKKIQILAALFMIPFIAFSQSATMPVILVSGTGKITHKDQVVTEVISGSIMNKKGTLTIPAGGKALIFHDFSFIQKSAADSPLDLSSTFNSQEKLLSQTESDLGEYVADAVYSALNSGIKMKNQANLISGWGSKGTGNRDGWGAKTSGSRDGWGCKGAGCRDGWGSKGSGSRDGWTSKKPVERDGWGSKGTGSRDGWGCKGAGCRDGWGSKGVGGKDGWLNSEIVSRTLSPGGTYTEGDNKLTWQALPGTHKYLFVVEDVDNNIVFQREVLGTSFTLNTVTAKLESGKNYAWYVHHTVKRQVSTPVPFTVVAASSAIDALKDVKDLAIYKASDAITKELFEASQYQASGFFLLTQKKYNEIAAKAPGNNLAKMMYAFFCNEMGEIENAAAILEK